MFVTSKYTVVAGRDLASLHHPTDSSTFNNKSVIGHQICRFYFKMQVRIRALTKSLILIPDADPA
jgi:hypothetical protein